MDLSVIVPESADFENLVEEVLCGAIGDQPFLHLEVPIDPKNGRAIGDGWECGAKRKQDHEVRPDFLLKHGKPRDGQSKTLGVGDFKLRTSTLLSTLTKQHKKQQWRAMWRHAKAHGFPPHVVIFIVWEVKKEADLREVRKKIQGKGVRGFIVILKEKRFRLF